MKPTNKKGQVFSQLGALAVGVVTLTIVLVIGFLIIAEAQSQIQVIDTNGTAYNATIELQSALATVAPWVPIVIIVAIGAILLAMIALFRRR